MENESKARYLAVPLPLGHVNPVMDFYVYSGNERCFVCQCGIDHSVAYPCFDFVLKDQDDQKAQVLFEEAGSFGLFHPTKSRHMPAKGVISSCTSHELNLVKLRNALRDKKEVDLEVIQKAMDIDLPSEV